MLGIIIDVIPLQPLKAFSPIDLTPLGICEVLHPTINSPVLVFIIALQLSGNADYGIIDMI